MDSQSLLAEMIKKNMGKLLGNNLNNYVQNTEKRRPAFIIIKK